MTRTGQAIAAGVRGFRAIVGPSTAIAAAAGPTDPPA